VSQICYCTNVHPAEDLAGVLRQLDTHAGPVRAAAGLDRLGLGLWLAADVVAGLAANPSALAALRGELDARELDVLTLNAFPYGGFHAEVVKHAVYRPRWTDKARLDYTAGCATVLAGLLADDAESGSISTLPLGWREPWSAADDEAAGSAMHEITKVLREVSARLGKPIRLAVEPEPGCVLDTVADAVGWLAPRVDPEFVGLCLDTCHLAVSFADPAETVAAIHDSGLAVVKVQASAALHIDDPRDPESRRLLAEFVEPRYLHQVRELSASGQVLAADDLPDAFGGLPAGGPWRVHFHVPLHAEPQLPLTSTTGVIRAAVAAVPAGTLIEVETYTWEVLPERHRQDLVHGIAAELRWAATELGSERVTR
jgi:sugar phosphate isomerase/epimerase